MVDIPRQAHATTYSIRPAQKKDADIVAKLWKDMGNEHCAYDAERWELVSDCADKWKKWFLAMLDRRDAVILAAVDGNDVPAGYVMGQVQEPVPVFAPLSRGVIHEIAVARTARRKGVGTRLMNEAVSVLQSMGAGQIELRVAAANAPAVSLYRKLGMRVVMHEMYMRCPGGGKQGRRRLNAGRKSGSLARLKEALFRKGSR